MRRNGSQVLVRWTVPAVLVVTGAWLAVMSAAAAAPHLAALVDAVGGSQTQHNQVLL